MPGKKKQLPVKKSLRQATHPIPPKRVEPDKKKYDRQREKKRLRREVDTPE